MLYNFLFHRIHPVKDSLWDPMRPELFEQCIRYITNHFNVILLEELPEKKLKPLNKNYATISFDDGYRDNLEYAAPILKKYNCKASFYVVTNCIDQNIPTWTHILEHAFQYTVKQNLLMDFVFLPSHLRIEKLQDQNARIQYIKQLKPFLRICPHEHRLAIINRVQECFDDVEYPQLMMSWDDLRQLQNEGHIIGSHTVSHSVLSSVFGNEIILDELICSGKKIEQELGSFPLTISYPLGKYDERVITLARHAGYKMALAVGQKIGAPKHTNLFEIPRIELYNESWWKVRMRMNGSLERIKKLVGR